MSDKKDRLILALSEIDEKYIKEAESTLRTSTLIKVAVALVLVVGLALFLFLPYAPVTENIESYQNSEYFPLIQEISEYRLGFMQHTHKNRFESLMSAIGSVGVKGGAVNDAAPEAGGEMMENLSGDSYVEVTDNQVSGVIESDIFKMSDKYIFRLGYKSEEGNSNYTPLLRVYSIEKENTALICEFAIPFFSDEQYNGFSYMNMEMFLSMDCSTVTITKNYTSSSNKSKIGVVSIDVSNVKSMSVKNMVSIDGSLNTSRMVDGKLLLVTEYYFNKNKVDYNNPATFVPTIDRGNGEEAIRFEDIIYPDGIINTRYSVVALLDEDNLELLGANALLNFTSDVYISQNNVYISREYIDQIDTENGGYISKNMSEVAILNYSGERLEKKGNVTLEGWMKDQYSFDEKDGFLRIVASTSEGESINHGDVSSFSQKRNVSLYIFNLSDNSLAYSVEDFAIEGEEAASVRFNGDNLYVCSAVVISFTDPVYFFDLSDYENITYTDTGVIEGFSSSLVDMGEGFLLGIGQYNWGHGKIEIYEEQGDSVVSVDVYEFYGDYSTNYKAYFINREENLFGFAIEGYYDIHSNVNSLYITRYVLLRFNGYDLEVIDYVDSPDMTSSSVRSAYVDGYLYITTNTSITVRKIK